MGLHRQCLRWKMIIWTQISHHPRILCVLLGLILLFLSFGHERPNELLTFGRRFQENYVFIQEQLRQWNKNAHRTKPFKECELFTLRPKFKGPRLPEFPRTACQRIPPLPGSCDVADRIFFSKPPAACSHQQSFNFCELQKSLGGEWKVFCNKTWSKICLSPLSVGKINKQTGAFTWQTSGTPAKTSEMLTSYVQSLKYEDAPKHYGFCFIRCLIKDLFSASRLAELYPEEDIIDEESGYGEQLLILPPQVKPSDQNMKTSLKNMFNVNLVLVDSVSRQHFFRSLSKTVSVLKEVMSSLDSRSTVIDFELVQSIRSRTFENLQAIFSGQIDPSEKPFATQDMPPRPLELSYLYEKFKKLGYHTLLIEDLCYLWEWGIAKDLHFLNKSSREADTWRRMWKTLAGNSIDSVEVTLAMCKVLKANDVPDHFHGPDAVCFNGRHQHEYLLDYLRLYQHTLESRKLPYLTFTMTNVAHEGSGRRVQTLDASLASYVKFCASLQNTLTIIFSDHGNSYGSFIRETQEARIELFHPFMQFIIPRQVASKLGNGAMHALKINSFRLVSYLDLHHTLNHIIDPGSIGRSAAGQFSVSRKGLLEPIDANRTCNDIPRVMPNLCICQNYDTPLANNTNYNLFAYFAIGRLNDEIQRQVLSVNQREATRESNRKTVMAFKKCQRLTLLEVQNVKRSFDQNQTQTLKMDLRVQQSQVFFVAVTISYTSQGQGDYKSELAMYDRITPYSMFSICADNIDLPLCICDTSKSSADSVKVPHEIDLENMYLLPPFETVVQDVNSVDQCLFLLTLKHQSGAVVHVANTCQGTSFILTAALEAENHLVYFTPPVLSVVLPGGMGVLGLIFSETGNTWSGSVKVSSQVVTDVSALTHLHVRPNSLNIR